MSKIKSVDEYIQEYPLEIQKRLNEIKKLIKELAPDAEEKISYNMPTFFLNGNLVHFAAFKNHIGLYPLPSAIAKFEPELTNFKHAKGSIQFPHDKDLPIQLIRQIILFRIDENTNKEL